MAVTKSEEIVALVRDLKSAIQQAQLQTPDIVVTRAELELKATLTKGPGVEAKFQALELSGHYTRSEIQTLNLSLTPKPPAVRAFSPVSDQLADAIATISFAAREAANSNPKFDLQESSVSLNIGVDKGGKAMVIVGGTAESSNYHTLKLTLKPK